MINIGKTWEPHEDAILHEWIGKIRISDMVEKNILPGRTLSAISGRMKKIGLKSGLKNTLYKMDLEFFKTPNVENCYWSGFLCADGAIIKDKNKPNGCRLTLCISVKDESHLVKFKEAIKHNGVIKYKTQIFNLESSSSHGKSFDFCWLDVCQASRFLNDMEQYGLIPNKTKRLAPPRLANDLLKLAYLRGYIDGDGYTTVISLEGRDRLTIGITSSCKAILDWIKDLVDHNFPVQYFDRAYSSVTRNSSSNSWQYNVSGYRALRLAEVLIKIPTPVLDRKWNRDDLRALMTTSKLQRPEWWAVRLPIEDEVDAYLAMQVKPAQEETQLSPEISLPPV